MEKEFNINFTKSNIKYNKKVNAVNKNHAIYKLGLIYGLIIVNSII